MNIYSFVFPSDSRTGFTAHHFHQYFETHTWGGWNNKCNWKGLKCDSLSDNPFTVAQWSSDNFGYALKDKWAESCSKNPVTPQFHSKCIL